MISLITIGACLLSNVVAFLATMQPSQQCGSLHNSLLLSNVAASVVARNLRCSLQSSLQSIWQPPQEPTSSVVAFTAVYNLYGSLHRSQQAMF
ncbi:hypothetical protein Tco_1127073 [Tanacetum coccineum]